MNMNIHVENTINGGTLLHVSLPIFIALKTYCLIFELVFTAWVCVAACAFGPISKWAVDICLVVLNTEEYII